MQSGISETFFCSSAPDKVFCCSIFFCFLTSGLNLHCRLLLTLKNVLHHLHMLEMDPLANLDGGEKEGKWSGIHFPCSPNIWIMSGFNLSTSYIQPIHGLDALPLKFTLLSPILPIESAKNLTTMGTISMAFINSTWYWHVLQRDKTYHKQRWLTIQTCVIIYMQYKNVQYICTAISAKEAKNAIYVHTTISAKQTNYQE